MNLVIRNINAIKVHTFVDMVNYFIRLNGFEGKIECVYGTDFTSERTSITYIAMIHPTYEEGIYKRVTTFDTPSLFNDIIETDYLVTIERLARRFFFQTLDSMGWL